MIKILDSFISDKIAAGEVIERPVSIVKELIENSIDAGATTIYIEIKNGGKSYIRVTDNGCGIPSTEIHTAFLRHATSKIGSIQDLDNINTLGFRGEALASISAVSRLTVVSRTADSEIGTKYVLHGGQEISKEIVGSNIGTTIIVEDLFYNTPARRKFMSTASSESNAIITLLEHFAIYYANIKFALVNNGINVFTTSGDSNFINAITSIYPTSEHKNLIEINYNNIHGYISNPGVTKTTRRGQLFFVNGRLVNSKVIEKGIDKGYGDRVFSGYPIVILFIDVEPNTIDVNIHPGKKEIKFLNEDEIINDVYKAIASSLNIEKAVPETYFKDNYVREESNQDYKAITKVETKKPIEIKEYLKSFDSEENKDPRFEIKTTESETPIEHTENKEFDFKELKFKGYIFNSYIIMQSEDSIYIFDQHACHERIFYEKFLKNYMDYEQIPQPIITPITLEVSSSIYAMDKSWIDAVVKMGFKVEDFGPNTFVVRAIPTFMSLSEANNFMKSFLENLGEYENNKTVIDKLITKSCKAAVKANNNLSSLEISDLMHELSKCKNPFSCPHGRPTFIKVTQYEIERSFKRK